MIQDAMQAIVWTSVLTSALLAVFMFVQAAVDPPRRLRFAAFGATWAYLTALDLLFPVLGPGWYELLRLAWCGGYVGSLIWLLEDRPQPALAAAFGLPILGLAVRMIGRPDLATTVAFTTGLGVAAWAHGRHYFRHQGFASVVLGAFSLAMAMECSTYAAAVASGDPRLLVLGYAHWAVMSLGAVLFGWIHLPREMKGRMPVRVEFRAAVALTLAVAVSEAGVLVGQFPLFGWPPYAYLAATLSMLAAVIAFYFRHRHRLVIYADNIGALLEERTASLRRAQDELARQNDILEEKLAAQARDLRAQSDVIERQRRLELAAQTAGQAAHDIQNLISPIFVQLARLDEHAGSAKDVRAAAGRIGTQLGHLLDLNHQLLTLARRGRTDFHPVRLDEALDELSDRFPGRSVRIETGGPAWVSGSWSQISRAVTNLVSNALDSQSPQTQSSPRGGERRESEVVVRCGQTVVAETRRCHLGFLTPGRYAYLSVEDCGPGIPESIRDRIFEPFFSTKDDGHRSGSGLGLSIVAAVVEDHRGVIDLQTGPEGTRFTVWLPAASAPETADTAGPRAPGEATVLLVDDDPAILRHYGRVLEEAGYSVITAVDGFQVLSILRDEQADVVILDLKMPRMTGFETCFGIVHLRPDARLIVHSNYVDDEEKARLRREGVEAILEKPASRAELLRTVRQALDGRVPIADSSAFLA